MRRYLILLVVVVITAVIGYLIYLYVNNLNFKITKTNISQKSENVDVSSQFIFTFNRDLSTSEQDNVVKISPTTAAEVIVSNNEIIVRPYNKLLENTEYAIGIQNIKSVGEESIEDFALLFSTGLDNSDRAQFVRSLPHNTENYSITYIKDNDSFLITVFKTPQDKYEDEALDYMRSQGINTSQDRIKVELIRSLRGSGAPPG